MTYSINTHTIVAGEDEYDLSFAGVSPGYIEEEHVKYYIGSVEQPDIDRIFLTATRVKIDPVPLDGVEISFRRKTSPDVALVDWLSGKPVTEVLLDKVNTQYLYLYQEASDSGEIDTSFAQASAELAEQWAEELEDVEVISGKYSALHHAIKSALSAAAASVSETNALTAEAAAEAAAIEAENYASSNRITRYTSRDGVDLSALIATISTDVVTLVIDQKPDALTADLLIPSNVSLEWHQGCTLGGAYTLTINGLIAGRYQLFESSVTVLGSLLAPVPVLEWFGGVGDNSIDNAVAFLAMCSYVNSADTFIHIQNGVYKISNSLSGLAYVNRVVGDGWHLSSGSATPTGSVINTSEGLVFTAPNPSERGFALKDFAINYTGVGDVISIKDNIRNDISNLRILCNTTGARGIVLQSYSYFTVLDQIHIKSFTDVGILLDSGGTKSVIRDCHLSAAVSSDANSGLEIRNEGTSVYDGQINVENVAGDGVGILWNNTTGAVKEGGYVNGTLCEVGTGIKVTGITHGWSGLIFENTRTTLGGGNTTVIFDRASGCKLINPTLYGPTAGTVVEFTANAIRCGLIGNYNSCRSGIIVDALATDCYSICVPKITYAARASITTNSNLTVTCNDVEYVGKTIHNGVAWDKYSEYIVDDTAVSITPPDNRGLIELKTTTAGEDYALVAYDIVSGITTDLVLGSSVEVNATDGTLTGTTGTDTKITIRCSSTGVVYIENRRGGARRFLITFK